MKFPNNNHFRFGRVGYLLIAAGCVVLLSFTMHMDDKKVEMVVLSTTYGDMTIRLYEDTPLHRDNFLKLAREGYYDGLLFHRVINNFMIQGGDPESRNAAQGTALGTGGPGYTIPAEFRAHHIHKKGALAAARQGDQVNPNKESSGSQFYIVHGNKVSPNMLINVNSQRKSAHSDWPDYNEQQSAIYASEGGTPHLDGGYTVFGEVISGLHVIDSIAAQPCDRQNRPLKNIEMKLKIERKKWP